MKVRIEIDRQALEKIVLDHIRNTFTTVKDADVKIQVKSAQNYKSEWEHADFRAVVEIDR